MTAADPPSFSELLRGYRLAAGLTQEALADRSGLSVRGIQDLERGVTRPLKDTVLRLSVALALSAADRALFEEAGARPPRRLDAAASAISRGDPPHNLPASLTSFVGRRRDGAEVMRLLVAHRVATLTGPPGIGKTRLALHVAAGARDRYRDGVWLVELAALADPALVARAVATALGVRELPGRSIEATLCDAVRRKRLLLVLDNCEHLIGACAHLVEALARACPHVHVLVTSRELLSIGGEAHWRLPPLSLPDPQQTVGTQDLARYEAAQLFIERATVAEPAWTLTDRDASALAQVCRRLDGIPLAIELAAARASVLSVGQMAARLDDRFQVLTGGSRTALPRHQTLRATIDWSYDLLTAPERTLFSRLSVFAGGWTLDAAETVCADASIPESRVLDLLAHLVDKSLVDVEQGDEQARYRMLETIREYAAEKLRGSGDAPSARQRHVRWCLGLAQRVYEERAGPEQAAWFDRLEREHDNVRAALHRSIAEAGDDDAVLRLATAPWRFWIVRGHVTEGRQWLAKALAASATDAPSHMWRHARADALAAAAILAHFQSDLGAARSLFEEALAVHRELEDPFATAADLNGLGAVTLEQMDYERARAALEESLALGPAHGKALLTYRAMYHLGRAAHAQGDVARARTWFQDALAMQRASGDAYSTAKTLRNLGEIARSEGDCGAAASLLKESLSLSEGLGDTEGVARTLGELGYLAVDLGDHACARARFRACLPMHARAGSPRGLAKSLQGFAELAAAEGDPARAIRLAGAVAALRESVGVVLPAPERARLSSKIDAAHRQVDEATAGAAWAGGQAMTLEQAIAEALADGG